MPSIFKKQVVRFSAPPVLNKHTRGPPPKRREKFATAADRGDRQTSAIINHKSREANRTHKIHHPPMQEATVKS